MLELIYYVNMHQFLTKIIQFFVQNLGYTFLSNI